MSGVWCAQSRGPTMTVRFLSAMGSTLLDGGLLSLVYLLQLRQGLVFEAWNALEDVIEDRTLGVFLGPPARLRCRPQRFDQVPFFTTEVARVRCLGFMCPMLPDHAQPWGSFGHAHRAGDIWWHLCVQGPSIR
jgi:hypothetical protein